MNKKQGISICISAYNNDNYIEECLDSIQNQTYFINHNNYEILLGIDGCEKTLNKVIDIMDKYKNIKVVLMTENRGTYIICNTLMYLAQYEWLLRFDSDDIMLPNMVEVFMNYSNGEYDLLYCNCQNFYDGKTDTKDRQLNKPFKKGIYEISSTPFQKKTIFNKFGGFQPWRCSADSEYKERLHNVIKNKRLPIVLYKRRLHDESLTRKEGELSAIDVIKGGERYRNMEYVKNLKVKTEQDAIIKCVTGKYKIIFDNTEDTLTFEDLNKNTTIQEKPNKTTIEEIYA